MQNERSRIIITAVLLFIGISAKAQSTSDEQLAAFYLREGEFDKAGLYYERLYAKSPSEDNYRYFLGCLVKLNEFKDAERLAERHARANPGVMRYQIEIGHVIDQSGEVAKADRYYDKLVKSMNSSTINQILDAGQAFTNINEPDRALEVYYIGRKKMGIAYPINVEIARVLESQGDIEGAVNEYLDLLELNTSYILQVQSILNRVIGFNADSRFNLILQQQLERRVQKNPEREIYAQMLIWMFVQQNRYEVAMINAKALDKRTKGDGSQVIELADLAFSNYKYKVAADGYSYVKGKGELNYYFIESSIGLLQALTADVTKGNYNQVSISQLLGEYQSTILKLGQRANVALIMLDYAHVKAFYESKYSNRAINEAIAILQDALSMKSLPEMTEAKLKMELGEIYIINDQIWDASLLFTQVEKKFKYDEIGFQAKLKNALVFYYSGDFGWAESQLSALKGSTSKLISNDALELSAFISENTGLDTTTDALAMFAHVQLFEAQHKYDSAFWMLLKIEEMFPYHELQDNIIYERARIYAETGDYEKSLEFYEALPKLDPTGILADNAIMSAGLILEEKLNRVDDAMEMYRIILSDYKGSLFVVEARKRYRNLRGDAVQ